MSPKIWKLAQRGMLITFITTGIICGGMLTPVSYAIEAARYTENIHAGFGVGSSINRSGLDNFSPEVLSDGFSFEDPPCGSISADLYASTAAKGPKAVASIVGEGISGNGPPPSPYTHYSSWGGSKSFAANASFEYQIQIRYMNGVNLYDFYIPILARGYSYASVYQLECGGGKAYAGWGMQFAYDNQGKVTNRFY